MSEVKLMQKPLGRMLLVALGDCASWQHGMHTSWRVKTMPKLEALGLVEKRQSRNHESGKAWFVTDAGRAILRGDHVG